MRTCRACSARVVLELDGRPLHVRPTAATFPELDAFRRGEGTIRVQSGAVLPPLADGDHQLHFRNTHDRGASVYLANALVPKSARVGVTAQRRDGDQSELTIDFVTSPGSATPVRIWLLATLAGAVALAGFLTRRWRARSRRGRMLSVASAAALGTLAAGLFSATPFAQKSEPPARTSFVELDAVVLDKADDRFAGSTKEIFRSRRTANPLLSPASRRWRPPESRGGTTAALSCCFSTTPTSGARFSRDNSSPGAGRRTALLSSA